MHKQAPLGALAQGNRRHRGIPHDTRQSGHVRHKSNRCSCNLNCRASEIAGASPKCIVGAAQTSAWVQSDGFLNRISKNLAPNQNCSTQKHPLLLRFGRQRNGNSLSLSPMCLWERANEQLGSKYSESFAKHPPTCRMDAVAVNMG
jgi:hypothetical protein